MGELEDECPSASGDESGSRQEGLGNLQHLHHTQFSALSPTARFDLQGAQVDPMFLQPTTARSPRRLQITLRLNW